MKKTEVQVLIDKETLFYGLARLYQLMEDADPVYDDEDVVVTPEDDEPPSLSYDPPPKYFEKFFDAEEALRAGITSEFTSLFALLSEPLLKDPQLKKEFQLYALEHFGEEINFYEEVSLKTTKRPVLSIVQPKYPNTPDDAPPKGD